MKTINSFLVLCCVAFATSDDVDTFFRLAARAEKANLGEVPYQVSLQFSGKHFCGGALISRSHVLTAGHCLADFFQSPYLARAIRVEVGSVRIGTGKLHQVKRISHAKNFDADPYIPEFIIGDVAVITLKTPITESDHARVIALPSKSSDLPVDAKVLVSGFGNARVGGPVSKNLQKTELFIVSRAECNRYYRWAFHKSIESYHVCAKRGNGYGACQGDSGGPMAYNNEVVGLVSGGDGNCGGGNPDVYTRVSSYLDYINYELNYDFNKPEKPNGPAKAINIEKLKSSQVGGMWPPFFPPISFPPSGFPEFENK